MPDGYSGGQVAIAVLAGGILGYTLHSYVEDHDSGSISVGGKDGINIKGGWGFSFFGLLPLILIL